MLEHEQKPLGAYVLMYSPMNNRAAAISIPGDTGRILRTINRVDRLDSVYLSHSTEAFETEIQYLLELTIDYCIVIETENLSRIIDLIGGVTIFIPNAINFEDEVTIHFPSGNTRLDGDKGIQYIIFEFPEEEQNAASLRRERFFLGFLKSLGENYFLLQDTSISRNFFPLIKTRMNRLAQRRLFESLSALDIDRILFQSIAGTYQEVSGERLLMPHYDGMVIRDVVRQAQRSLAQRTQGTLMERIFTVEILNGTTTTGMAGRTADLIRGFNYDVVSIGNADRNDYENTEVIDRTGYEQVANSFAAVIQCRNIRYESRIPDEADLIMQDRELLADFTLVIGRDFNGRIVVGN